MIPADSTIVYNNVPRPKSNGTPLLHLESPLGHGHAAAAAAAAAGIVGSLGGTGRGRDRRVCALYTLHFNHKKYDSQSCV